MKPDSSATSIAPHLLFHNPMLADQQMQSPSKVPSGTLLYTLSSQSLDESDNELFCAICNKNYADRSDFKYVSS